MFRNPKLWLVVVLVLLILGMSLGSAQAGDKEDLVGRWDQVLQDGNFWRFNADGTYKQVTNNKVVSEGKYRMLPGAIEIDKVEYKYRRSYDIFLGDVLELTFFGQRYMYTRSK